MWEKLGSHRYSLIVKNARIVRRISYRIHSHSIVHVIQGLQYYYQQHKKDYQDG